MSGINMSELDLNDEQRDEVRAYLIRQSSSYARKVKSAHATEVKNLRTMSKANCIEFVKKATKDI